MAAAAESALALADAIEATFSPSTARDLQAAARLDGAAVRWAPCSGADALGAYPGAEGAVPAMAEVAAAVGAGVGGGGRGRGGGGGRSREGGGGGRGGGGGSSAIDEKLRLAREARKTSVTVGSGGGHSGRGSGGRDPFASRGNGRVQGGALGGGGGGSGRGGRGGAGGPSASAGRGAFPVPRGSFAGGAVLF